MFEQAFPTPYELVYPPALDAGGLNQKYDVLIFPEGGIPGGGRVDAAEVEVAAGTWRGAGGHHCGRGRARRWRPRGDAAAGGSDVPDEFRNEIGNVTLATTGPQLHRFVEGGGTSWPSAARPVSAITWACR